MLRNIITLAVVAFCAAAVTGCGGGGDDSATPNPQPPVSAPGDLQTSVPTPTYPVGSEELVFFNLLNDFRAKLGLGLLKQNASLDKSNENHVGYMLRHTDIDYLSINPRTGKPVMHDEEPGRLGYTGVAAIDRAKFTGYDGSWVSEQVAYGVGGGSVRSFGALVASVYHREGLMFQFPREFGIKVGADTVQTTVLSFGGSEGNWQRNASDYFAVYPANNQTGVGLSTYPELPNPYPDITLSEFATKTSFPVSVTSERSTTLKVDSFTVKEAGQASALDARLITAENDSHKLLAKHAAYLVAKAPFKPNTTYNVAFKGTIDGVNVTRNWSFSTRPE